MLFFITREKTFVYNGKRLGKAGKPRGFFVGEVLSQWLVQNKLPEGLPGSEVDAAKALWSLVALIPDPRQRRRLRANEAAATVSVDTAWKTLLPYYSKCQVLPLPRRVAGKRQFGFLVAAPDTFSAAVAEIMLLRGLGGWVSLCIECFGTFRGRPVKVKTGSIWKGEGIKRSFLCPKCRRKLVVRPNEKQEKDQFLAWLRGLVRDGKITPEERDKYKARLKETPPQRLRQEITEKLVAEGRLRRYRPRLRQ